MFVIIKYIAKQLIRTGDVFFVPRSQRFASKNISNVGCIERSLLAGFIDLFPNILGIVHISRYLVQQIGGNAIILEKATLHQNFDSLNIGLAIERSQ